MLGQTESVFTRQVQIYQKNVNAGFLGANTMFAGRVLCAPTFCLATFFAVAATDLPPFAIPLISWKSGLRLI